MIRLQLVFSLFVLMFILIIIRLFYWQILQNTYLAQAAVDQYYFSLKINADRGEILASDSHPLVTNTQAFLAFAEIPEIKQTDEFIHEIADVLDLDSQNMMGLINRQDVVWIPLKHKISLEQKTLLESKNIPGLGFEKESSRFYPESSMAAHLLGFVGSDDDGSDKGYFGLEGWYNQALTGKPGLLIQEKDARGLPILLGNSKRITPQPGQTLETYIDRSVQMIVEKNLLQGLEKYGASQGLVAVMDPKTGGIISNASFPNYDPANFSSYDDDLYPNPLAGFTYEPGSTFKTMVMAAALNEGKIKPDTKYDESGPIQIGQYAIRTWNNQYHGQINAAQILEKSSNPGMVFVGKNLGLQKMWHYLTAFGFGSLTDIDLEGEEKAAMRSLQDWKEIDLATASFGQGIAVTPIQMLRAVSALANQGKLMQPQIVKRIIDIEGKTIEKKPRMVRQVIKPTAAKQITDMMVVAVDQGEAKWAKPAGFKIAGKTGTAQIPVAGHYDQEKTIASFIGFAPADDPKFVMLVILREPTTSPWGSETAAPLFFNISKELFAYYGIFPQN